MRLRNAWVGVLGAALALSTVACGGGGGRKPSSTSAAPTPAAAPAGGGQKVDTATAGDVKGVVTLDGDGAEERADQDERRSGVREAEQRTAVPGNLRGRRRRQVARQRVRVREGRPRQLRLRHADRARRRSTRRTAATTPHVFGMRVGQPLEIVNSDPTLHNIHAMPKGNPEFNNGQPIQGMKTTHTFANEGGDGAVQVRRARLDERLRRRAGPPVLRRRPTTTASSS